MELKPGLPLLLFPCYILLIVPYGIETYHLQVSVMSYFLLIVPYGIETRFVKEYLCSVFCLLIVPYGIETLKVSSEGQTTAAFNCTLWN